MKKHVLATLSILVLCSAVSAFAGVTVSSPTNNSTVNGSVYFKATASTPCAKGVASMGIYPAPYQLAYVVNGNTLSTTLNFNPGTYGVVVEEWDNCGAASTKPVTINVSGSGKTFTNIQSHSGWRSYAQQPPSYADCNYCTPSGPGTTWAMYQGVKSPTLSGSTTQYNLGGTMAYS